MAEFDCGLQFRAREGPDRGRYFPLDHRDITVGKARVAGDRAPGWVLIFDPAVQRIHAEMSWNADEQAFQLTARPGGIAEVNGEPVGCCLLDPGDVVRFGDTVLLLQATTTALGAPPPRLEAERSQDNLKTLKMTRSRRWLHLLSGSQAGETLSLQGDSVQLGGNRPENIPEDRRWWEQDLMLPEAELPYRFMAWHWNDSEKAYRVSLLRPVNLSLSFERTCDGIHWIAEMPKGPRAEVLLRNTDRLSLGKFALELRVEEF